MGEIRVNLSNFLAIGLMAFIAVYGINKVLDKTGMGQYKA